MAGGINLAGKAALSDVYITEELARRQSKKPDYRQEKEALQELAGCMADRPAEVLPQFVELAMKLTGGVSAGLSLYEDDPAPGVFRWRYLRGELAAFEGALTPRDDSPCGVTLNQNSPVLARHPERVYDWISNEHIVVPEVLLVPLYIGGDEPLGTLWIVSDAEGLFNSGDARVAVELAKFVGIALRMLRSEVRLRSAFDEQEMLAKEMSHRLKNLFAMTDGMIHGSLRNTASAADLAEALSGRLHALADAHSLVQRKVHALGVVARSTALGELIETIVKAHHPDLGETARFSIDGPDILCGDRAINGFALLFHELATNAAKYGALKSNEGHVDICWRHVRDDVVLTWTETGGPVIEATPDRTGFGSQLVKRTVERQFAGTINYDWRRGGLAVTLAVPAKLISA